MAVELVAIPLWGLCIMGGFAIVGVFVVFVMAVEGMESLSLGLAALALTAAVFVVAGLGIVALASTGDAPAPAAPTAVPGAATPTTAGEVR